MQEIYHPTIVLDNNPDNLMYAGYDCHSIFIYLDGNDCVFFRHTGLRRRGSRCNFIFVDLQTEQLPSETRDKAIRASCVLGAISMYTKGVITRRVFDVLTTPHELNASMDAYKDKLAGGLREASHGEDAYHTAEEFTKLQDDVRNRRFPVFSQDDWIDVYFKTDCVVYPEYYPPSMRTSQQI